MMYNPYGWKIVSKKVMKSKKEEQKCLLEQISEISNQIDIAKIERDKKREELSKILKEYNNNILSLEVKKRFLLSRLSEEP